MSKNRVLIISGPTASGKSKAALNLALQLRGQGIKAEIISADSAQVYRSMDIGTDKLKPEERMAIPHHLIDIVNPDEHFDAEIFRKLASAEIERINHAGGVPVLAGGTGFWIHALLYGLFPSPARSDEIRDELKKTASEKGTQYLHAKLSGIDPESAQRIHPNDLFRLVRALEVYQLTGKSLTEHFQSQRKEKAFNALYLALNLDRSILYDRIGRRVEEMMTKGFLEEVKKLRQMGYGPELASQKIIGYKELHDHLEGKMDLDQAAHAIKTETRHYARRQLIWLRKEKDVSWIDGMKEPEQVLEKAGRFLEL